jgi:hypothetical protein
MYVQHWVSTVATRPVWTPMNLLFLFLKITAGVELAVILVLFVFSPLAHTSFSSGGGPYPDSLTAFYFGYLWPTVMAATIGGMIGFNPNGMARVLWPYILGLVMSGIAVVFMLFVWIIALARAANCASDPSTPYCLQEGGQLSLYWVTVLIAFMACIGEIVCLVLQMNKRKLVSTTSAKNAGAHVTSRPAQQPINKEFRNPLSG